MKKIGVIIQARYNSTRLPGKVLNKIGNQTILDILVKRIKKSKKISNLIVALTENSKDKKIYEFCKKNKLEFFLGSEQNVLKRYYLAAKYFNLKTIIRITSDCPFIDPKIIDKVLNTFIVKKLEYCSNTIQPTYADGQDVEVFTFKLLEEAFLKATTKYDKEHVTPYIKRKKNIKKYNVIDNEDLNHLRITVDEKVDLLVLNKIYKYFKNFNFSYKQIKTLYKKRPEIFHLNSHINRDVGSKISTGQKMWKRANNVIPGGTMLFSKNPDLQLPKLWPAYFSRAKDCSVWDLDKKKYIDFFSMGIGTNTLGYSNESVEKRVKKTLINGNMSSLNSIEEILLAEKLIDMHPWADMARFTRSGGEANAVAVRIARAYTGKDKIAFCGYHGWHDWYLSANLENQNNLNTHLLNNLKIKGVPKSLKRTSMTFNYNDFDSLKKILSQNNDVGAVKMEVQRDLKPDLAFLRKVRDITKKKNIILIFDECTSGFRETFGGLHLKYKIDPDIAIFGKALGNGYAINAILGRKDIMNSVKNTFISSTFWTERSGSAAALATLNVMENTQSWKKISKIGKEIKSLWKKISNDNSVEINISGLDALPKFYFNSPHHSKYKTYLSQEMLKKGILASNFVYTCIFHNDKIVQKYSEILSDVFHVIGKCEKGDYNILDFLKTETCMSNIRDQQIFVDKI